MGAGTAPHRIPSKSKDLSKDDVCLEQGSAAAETEQRNNDLLVVCTLAAVLQLVTYNRT